MSTQLSAVVGFNFTVFAEATRWLRMKLIFQVFTTSQFTRVCVFGIAIKDKHANGEHCAAWSSSSSTFTKSQIKRN
jgi:hypothetical protein